MQIAAVLAAFSGRPQYVHRKHGWLTEYYKLASKFQPDLITPYSVAAGPNHATPQDEAQVTVYRARRPESRPDACCRWPPKLSNLAASLATGHSRCVGGVIPRCRGTHGVTTHELAAYEAHDQRQAGFQRMAGQSYFRSRDL